MPREGELLALLLGLVLATAWSTIEPHDRLVWWMEALPVFIAVQVLAGTYGRFPLTRLLYYLIFLHSLILLVGAHYTYSRVPVGNWFQEALNLDRNHYDRFAHVWQGLVPGLAAREVLMRLKVVNGRGWLFFLVCCVALAVSALYELVEWQAAVWGGDSTLSFLGVQGDLWDAQWDMLLALCGAIVGQLLLARWHNRQIEAVRGLGQT